MLERQELAGYQDPETGRWRIPRAHIEDLKERREQEGRKKPTPPAQEDAPSRELVEELRDRVKFLEDQLRQERQATERANHIVAGLVQRIPELPAPQEPSILSELRESPVTATEGRNKPRHTPPPGPHTGSQRPWWRRIFEGYFSSTTREVPGHSTRMISTVVLTATLVCRILDTHGTLSQNRLHGVYREPHRTGDLPPIGDVYAGSRIWTSENSPSRHFGE